MSNLWKGSWMLFPKMAYNGDNMKSWGLRVISYQPSRNLKRGTW